MFINSKVIIETYMNNINQHSIEEQSLQNSLIPNFHNLNHLIQEQMKHIIHILMQKDNIKLIQEISRNAILEECPLLRSHIWKSNNSIYIVLLGSLPPHHSKWTETIQANFKFYQSLVERIFPALLLESSVKIPVPFDQQLWQQISLDTKRTHSVLSFFKNEVKEVRMYQSRPTKHADILGRILYIWGKVNPRIRYVQGMNQILAPLYYLECQADNPYNQSQVFFMFSALMNFSIDMHSKQMDGSEQGIMGRISTLNRYLKVVDLQIWIKLQQQHIMAEHYSFRWLALLLSQQFQLHDTMRIWDVLFSFDVKQRFFFLYCVCLSIIKARKECIMNSDLIGILPKLQKLKDLQADDIIENALKLYDKYSKVSIEKLYHKIDSEIKQRKKSQNNNQNTWNYTQIFKSTTNFIANQLSYLKNNP